MNSSEKRGGGNPSVQRTTQVAIAPRRGLFLLIAAVVIPVVVGLYAYKEPVSLWLTQQHHPKLPHLSVQRRIPPTLTTVVDLNIPRAPLSWALPEFAYLAKISVSTGTSWSDLEGTLVGPLSGAMTIETALDKLLRPAKVPYCVSHYEGELFLWVYPPGACDALQREQH